MSDARPTEESYTTASEIKRGWTMRTGHFGSIDVYISAQLAEEIEATRTRLDGCQTG